MDLLEQSISEYKRWVDNTKDDAYMQQELAKLEQSKDELLDCFSDQIKFGTSGLRGIIGPGPHRINKYVVARVTQGLCDYINNKISQSESMSGKVVIAYDSRHFSREFAEITAEILSGNELDAYLFDDVSPVPLLSYSIQELDCDYGIMITASHNSSIYNGYKVFNRYGYQVVGDEPKEILDSIFKHDFFDNINKSRDRIYSVEPKVADKFLEDIDRIAKSFSNHDKYADKSRSNLRIVYTPLNGAGKDYILKSLENAGFDDVILVETQADYDPDFTTCKLPNPEKLSAYNEAFRMLDQQDGDIIIASDPDSDRVGVAIIHDGTKINLSGNQMGLLMLDYLTEARPPQKNQICYRSIVSTPLADRIADANGLTLETTLTGFKYIGEAIEDLIQENKENLFYFGFEESNGFLSSPYIRDKDAISSAVLMAEIAAKHKSRGQDLIDHLEEIYGDYGTLTDKSKSFSFEGFAGQQTMEKVMEYFRDPQLESIGDLYIEDKTDYLLDDTGLPKSNIVRFDLDDGSTAIIRPSGTEPKIKIYMYLTDPTSTIDNGITEIMEEFKQS